MRLEDRMPFLSVSLVIYYLHLYFFSFIFVSFYFYLLFNYISFIWVIFILHQNPDINVRGITER